MRLSNLGRGVIAAVVIVAVLLLGGGLGALIFGGSTTTITPLTPVRHHPCSASSFYMQCVGPATPALIAPGGKGAPPKLGTFKTLGAAPSASGAGFGVDFAWSRPAASAARAFGARFGAGYLSGTSKDFFNASDYRAHGLGVVFVWETYANRSLAGYNAGYSDAYQATHEAQRLGFRTGHIDFATDFDSTGRSDFVPYYQGAAAWDRRAGFTTGAYGGLNTVRTLCARGITTANWQTLAWSYGYWVSASCAPLRQTGINSYWHGYSVDYDQAIAAYYGQSNPGPKPKPKPPRLVCFGAHAQHTAKCAAPRRMLAEAKGAEAASLHAFRARGCRQVRQTRNYFDYLVRHFPHSRKIAYRRAALRASRRTYGGLRCPTYDQRYRFFKARAAAITNQFS